MFKSTVVNKTEKKLILSYCAPSKHSHKIPSDDVHFAICPQVLRKPFGPCGQTEKRD